MNSHLNRGSSWIVSSVLLIIVLSVPQAHALKSIDKKKAKSFYEQGQEFLSKGMQEKALLKFYESVKYSKKANYTKGLVYNYNEMAIIYTSIGKHNKARALLQESIELGKKNRMQTEVSKALNNVALISIAQQRYDQALTEYQELLKWDRKTGNQLGEGITLNNMGLIYEKKINNRDKARKYYTKSIKRLDSIGAKKQLKMVEKNLKRIE